MACQHLNRVGDNYGETCGDCGATLRGHGYWAQDGGGCRHEWMRDGECETCVYCEASRLAPRETDQ